MLCKNEDLHCFPSWLGCLIWRKYLLCQAEILLRFLSGDPIIFTMTPFLYHNPSILFQMASKEEKRAIGHITEPMIDEGDAALRALGYVPSFKREFSNISTVRLLTPQISQIHLSSLIRLLDLVRV